MPDKYKKPIRVILYVDAVGDYTGAYDFVNREVYNDPAFSLGFHPSHWPGEEYTVVELTEEKQNE